MSFTKIILTIFVISIVLSSCVLRQKSEQEAMSEIYSDVMAYGFSRENIDYCQNGDLIISSLTENYDFDESDWEWAKGRFPKLEPKTWENFLAINSQQIPFPSDLNLGCKYILLDIKQNPPDTNLPWDNCVGIEYFSQIGYNSEENQALVYRAISCSDFAFGNLYFLEITDGHWIVTDMAELFIT